MRRSSMIIPLVASILLLFALPASASAKTADVRFVHAVPGVGKATLEAGGQPVGSAGFGEATDQVAVPAGQTAFQLSAPGGVELTGDEQLEAGKGYLLVAMATTNGAELRLFPEAAATSGDAWLRMIHAAPELGDADLSVGGKTIAKGAAFTDATDYIRLDPGDYKLAVQDPASGDAVLAENVPLAAGTANTALVVGSEGEATQVVLVEDDVTAPAGGPHTGFGGLADLADSVGRPDWPLTLLAAIFAGLLGVGMAGARWAVRASSREG